MLRPFNTVFKYNALLIFFRFVHIEYLHYGSQQQLRIIVKGYFYHAFSISLLFHSGEEAFQYLFPVAALGNFACFDSLTINGVFCSRLIFNIWFYLIIRLFRMAVPYIACEVKQVFCLQCSGYPCYSLQGICRRYIPAVLYNLILVNSL